MQLSKKIYTILFVLSFVFSMLISISTDKDKSEMLSNVISLYSERISIQMNRAIYITDILKEITRESNGELDENSFNALAHAVGAGIDYVAIQYMPNGIVEFVYPLAGNEKTLGHNLFASDATAIESKMAKEERAVIVSGPFNLLQGVSGLAVRNPLFLDDANGSSFWGFLTVVLPVPDVLKDTGIFETEKLGYQFRITAFYKNEDILFFETDDFNEKFARSTPIEIGNTVWTLSMYVKNGEQETLTQGVLIWSAFVLLSTFIYFIIKKVEYKLEKDPLTGAYNRRVLENYIKPKHSARGKKFALLYIDLNDFKPVNDTYGHETGDRLLIAYVRRIQANIKSDGQIFRIGGDEFVIIIPNVDKKQDLSEMIKRIAHFSQERFVIHGHDILVSASIGQALFPSEGRDLESLLKVADERMYANKQEFKKARKTQR